MIIHPRVLLGAGLALALISTGGMAQSVRHLTLPENLTYPEGIGFDPAGYVFTASASDGAVVRTSLRDGRSTLLVGPGILLRSDSAAFPRMLGIKFDAAGRLWIMGGRTGKVFVVDASSGRLIKQLSTPGGGGVLNDAVVTANAVYVTDTLRPILWRIPLQGDRIGNAEAWINLDGTPIAYSAGLNLNGIAISASGSSLIVVQMDKGLLFKVDIATKVITPIDVGKAALSGGDGLVLDGTTLYVVRQPEAEVVTLKLAPDLRSGQVIARFKHPALSWPATAVKVGDELVVVNSQFNKQDSKDPTLPFTLAVIRVSKSATK